MRTSLLRFGLVAALVAIYAPTAIAAEHVVEGQNGPNRWVYLGTSSGLGKVGDPAGRLAIPVQVGDSVRFTNVGGNHGVIFERAVAEENTVWERVAGPGTIGAIANLKPYYDAAQARGTAQLGAGNVITIKIKSLSSGQSILFGCNPHSNMPATNENILMIGKIVLADDVSGGHAEAHRTAQEFMKLPAAQSCKLITFEKAEVRPGIVNGTWLLVVSGQAPCLNMSVRLAPVTYVQRPEYWDIEVVGCVPGICLPAVRPFVETIDITSTLGTKGVRVAGATKQQPIDVPPVSTDKRNDH